MTRDLEAELARERFAHAATHGLYLTALDAQDGVLSRRSYGVILNSLHPDKRAHVDKAQRDEACRLFIKYKHMLVKKQDRENAIGAEGANP